MSTPAPKTEPTPPEFCFKGTWQPLPLDKLIAGCEQHEEQFKSLMKGLDGKRIIAKNSQKVVEESFEEVKKCYSRNLRKFEEEMRLERARKMKESGLKSN